eukprot:jgi/Picsp_1/6099/NSC_03453-R1_serine threonine-protein kinase ctr1-like
MYRCFFPVLVLISALSPLCLKGVQAAWGVKVEFENYCRRTIDVSVYSEDNSGTLTIGYGETGVFTICQSWCTGFLGSDRVNTYSFTCGDCANTPEPEPEPEPEPSFSYEPPYIYADAYEPIPSPPYVGSNGFQQPGTELQDPEPGDSGSSTNVGAIVGGVVGGVVGLALIILLIVLINRRPPSKDEKNHDVKAAGEVKDVANGTSKAAPAQDFDPYITWLKSLEKDVGPAHLTHSKEFAFSDVTITKPIGEGSFGKVYQGLYRDDKVAIKIFQGGESMVPDEAPMEALRRTGGKILEKMEKEVEFMSSLSNPNIVSLIGFCRIPPAIVTELCSQGNLAQKLLSCKEKNTQLEWKARVRYAYEISLGLEYLHAKNILHRDLKSPNVLINDLNMIKLTDFNLSKYMDATMQSSSIAAMNPRWLAPELFDGISASSASDIFSLGVIMWEILTLQVPWDGTNPWSIVERIRRGERLPYGYNPEVCQQADYDAYVGLMNACWAATPSERPTATSVVSSLEKMM